MGWRCSGSSGPRAGTRRAGGALRARAGGTCGLLGALLCACSFHSDPLLPNHGRDDGEGQQDAFPASSDSHGDAGAGDAGSSVSGAAGRGSGGSAMDAMVAQPDAGRRDATVPDAQSPLDAKSASDAEPPKPDASKQDAQSPPDAEPTPPPDAAPEQPDAQQCPCLCPHELAAQPTLDDCAHALCPIDECAPNAECRYVTHDTSGYYICDDPHDWYGAVQHCDEAAGAHLVAIDSADEDDFLQGELSDKTWIGGSDLAQEGVFRWQNGEVFWRGGAAGGGGGPGGGGPPSGVYANFLSYEPNDQGVGDGDGDCVILWDQEGAWADATCDDAHGFVCEFAVPLPP